VWKIETVLALSRLAGKLLSGGGIDSAVKPITVDPSLGLQGLCLCRQRY